jgi:hypothetical protein
MVRELKLMKGSKAKTRSAATNPTEFKHLRPGEQQALELGAEAEHASGVEREAMIRKSKLVANTDAKRDRDK